MGRLVMVEVATGLADFEAHVLLAPAVDRLREDVDRTGARLAALEALAGAPR